MQQIIVTPNATAAQAVSTGKPSIPLSSTQPLVKRKTIDPSSSSPKGERYPIPSFFEYRIKPREHDIL